MHMSARGFTLIEVLVALGIVAVTLVAGLQASGALSRDAQRKGDLLLAQLCADNALVAVRLSAQMPDVGDSTQTCKQASRTFQVTLLVRPTPNPNVRRVEAQVSENGTGMLNVSSVVGRY